MKSMRISRWAVGAGLATLMAGVTLVPAGLVSAAPLISGGPGAAAVAAPAPVGPASPPATAVPPPLPAPVLVQGSGPASPPAAVPSPGPLAPPNGVVAPNGFAPSNGFAPPVSLPPAASTVASAPRRGGQGWMVRAAAQYLGLGVAQLRTELRGGQSLMGITSGMAGKSVPGLTTALTTALQGRLGLAVTAGRLTSSQAQARAAIRAAALPRLLARPGGPRLRHNGLWASVLRGTAQYLGTNVAQLRSDLHAGQSLAGIANGVAGKSAAGLQAALVAAAQARLGLAVSAGRRTSSEAQARTAIWAGKLSRLLARPGEPQGGGVRWAGVLRGSARYLGLPVSTLRADLHAGQSLAGIANGVAGKSAAGLQVALVDARQVRLERAVGRGRLTAAQGLTGLTAFVQRLDALLAGTRSGTATTADAGSGGATPPVGGAGGVVGPGSGGS